MLAGLLLAVAFGVGHNGMAVYDADKAPGFAELQVTTTRNVDETPFTSWFMGGLHYQIEHHLFSSVPRHKLHLVAALLRPLCAQHGVPYRSTGLWEGTVEVLAHLKEIADDLRAHGPA